MAVYCAYMKQMRCRRLADNLWLLAHDNNNSNKLNNNDDEDERDKTVFHNTTPDLQDQDHFLYGLRPVLS